MNAIIRCVVRMGLLRKFRVFLIYEGYNGLIEGYNDVNRDESYIREADLLTVDHIIHKVFIYLLIN